MSYKYSILFFLLLINGIFLFENESYCQTISGKVSDAKNNNPLTGAVINIKGTNIGTATDNDGRFIITSGKDSSITLLISFLGYKTQEILVTDYNAELNIVLKEDEILLKTIEIIDPRITEKQKESPLTVESMNSLDFKATPALSFYDGLGHLKGVDLTSASIGFKVVNTRGFNSTSPVRSLQIIDGVDNQAPGLNFSLGNFLGASELDVQKAELIVGASSAFYGPNAFNGVLSMTTKSPFLSPGLSVSLKVGERGLFENAVRFAQVFKNKKGMDKFAYKMNLYYMQAYDWEATNTDATPNSLVGTNNPGGYDAVNRYADENINPSVNNASNRSGQVVFPGLGIWHRDGYWEKDLVDYHTKNTKLGVALHYKLKEDVELIYASNFGTGTTVYQGDNRYSLKDILFFQNRLELKKQDKYFIRAYATNEDAGKSYDAVFTAILLQDASKENTTWSKDYSNYWAKHGNVVKKVQALPGFPQYQYPNPYNFEKANAVMAMYSDSLKLWHSLARDFANNGNLISGTSAFFKPGTPVFDETFNRIVSNKSFSGGGSGIYDKSALYHIHGEYHITFKGVEMVTGTNYRLYAPNSQGTIFSDTSGRKIYNGEYGIYAGAEKKIQEKLKVNLAVRLDKNQNFKYLFSPAISGVYSFDEKNVLRLSFSSAIRNPTLLDQYLFYNVGRARLLGNLNGFDSLVTIPSLINYSNSLKADTLNYFNVAPIQPEKVKTIEIGYRLILKSIYIDASYYYSYYQDFLGYKLGADLTFDKSKVLKDARFYRVAANSPDKVTTNGFSIGVNYFFKKYYSINGNYSWNELDSHGSLDPLIPAFNTPKNKFNIGIAARDLNSYIKVLTGISDKLPVIHLKNIGFTINYKWVQGFLFEGSPQFTGMVPWYDMLDAQVSYRIPTINCTLKLGASNLLDNKRFQVYGGPAIGRMAYFSILMEPKIK